jgi:hypothetical protein
MVPVNLVEMHHISETSSVSIFRSEDAVSRFLRNVGILPNYTVTYLEYRNVKILYLKALEANLE